ncbi:MAG: PD-(D/E)XK nuclease-like domain-containing protein [Kiritimatiellae bacterium]|nr:PD-(D/E)XK nuclease-like domain-containing protein [Kiritimatiellia bacterium]
MERPKYLLDMPADEYHAATKRNEYTTSHRLNLFRKCPALYKKVIDGEIVEGDTAAFQLGRATHTFIIEGKEKFDAEYTVSDGPINPKTGAAYGRQTNAYKEWAAQQTMPVISSEDFALIEKMRTAVRAHAVAADILSQGFAEGTVRTEWDGEPVQARLDWFDPERGILADLKTCADIDRFQYDIRDFGYVTQMAFYAKCIGLADPALALSKVYLIAVEKKEPYRVAVVEFFPMTLVDGNEVDRLPTKFGIGNDVCIRELRDCRETGVWPTRYEQVLRI